MVLAIAGWVAAFVLLGAGNTVGYHRLLTHRAFQAGPAVRAELATAAGCRGPAPGTREGL